MSHNPAENGPAIVVRDLHKEFRSVQRQSGFGAVLKALFAPTYRHTTAVDSISFTINHGELIGFLGPNGAGKSTTLKMLSGILHPTSGSATVLGYTPWKDRIRFVRHIGAVFGQKSQLLWDIPPMDAFLLSQAVYDIPKKDFRERLDRLATLLEVTGFINTPTRSLSLGERMKCEFIMAMLHNPRIVFLDEPTIGLDIISKERIRTFIREMHTAGTTFILTTHDLEDIEKLAERVMVVNHGALVFDGSQSQLRSRLGTRKQIALASERDIADSMLEPGLTLASRVSPCEVLLELDTAVLSLPRFIAAMDERVGIRDITVQEIAIETVVKELYQSTNTKE